MEWPQYTYLFLTVAGLGVGFSRWGEPKKPDKHGGWAWLIANVLIIALLWAGNFFSAGSRWP